MPLTFVVVVFFSGEEGVLGACLSLDTAEQRMCLVFHQKYNLLER